MISKLRPTLGRLLSDPIVRVMARTFITPNALTISGFLVSAATAWALATGHLFIGGLLVLFSAWFDMLDGALAKMIGMTTRFGAILDSTLDRFSEAALFLGLVIYYSNHQNDTTMIAVSYAAIAGSFMVSYIRARAEGLGIDAEVGIFARPERIVLLTLGLLLTAVSSAALPVILWILAVGTNLTALRRLLHTRRRAEGA